MNISELKPELVWKNFYALTQIPRPSKHEEKVSEFLYNWGKSRGLETVRDEVGNIIIRKDATPGMENCRGVVLQGHMDMVPQKNSDVDHDFLTDPIRTRIDGDWVKATGTTLGADNGIGVAMGLAALESEDLRHGPLELLVTVDEETGMTGAFALKDGSLKGKILINIDSEEEGELCIGCAGGLDSVASDTYVPEAVATGEKALKMVIKGCAGGHSGMDICLGRANANKVAARIAFAAQKQARLADLEGGTLRNAIPRECTGTLAFPAAAEQAVKAALEQASAEVREEYKDSDPAMNIAFEAVPAPAQSLSAADSRRYLQALLACPHGVERMSLTLEGLIETSTNMAMVKIGGGKFFCSSLTRSSIDSAKMALADRIAAVFALAGISCEFSGGYSGWTPNADSAILEIMKTVYARLNPGKSAKVVATHGGLECGLLGAKHPGMDMVSCGPTIMYPHSPDEKLFIPSVATTWEFLKAVLAEIPQD